MYILHVETASHPNSLLGICVHHCVGSNPTGACEEFANDLELGGGFLCVL